ncbi:MAG: SHOCT domain-containing protein [Acidimicrobiales bacterium]
MGLMMRRRRPIARLATGAAVAGVAYHAGKGHEQQAQVNDQAQAAYAASQQAPAPQYAPPPPAPAAPAPAPAGGTTADLENLVQLHNAGALTDEEFSAAKAKLLGL